MFTPYLTTLSYSAYLSEMLCYIIIFVYIYKNDNVILRNSLSQEKRLSRNRKNAITLTGQFCKFISKTIVLTGYIITMLTIFGEEVPISRELSVIVIMCQYEIMSAVEVLASPELRRNFLLLKFWR